MDCARCDFLRHVMTNVVREYSIDQGLVPDAPTLGFLSEAREDGRIQPDRDELTRAVTEGRTANTSHCTKLIVGRLWQIREINLSLGRHTRTFLSGSLAAR